MYKNPQKGTIAAPNE
jgi:hypothetical protein